MLAKRCTRPYNYLVTVIKRSRPLVAPAIPVAVPTTTTPSPPPALPSPAATATALFRPVAAFAVNRTAPAGFKRHGCRLATTSTNHGCPRAHPGGGAPAAAVTPAIMLRMGWSVPTTAPGGWLSLAAWRTGWGRGVAAFLEKLLSSSSEDKFLPAVATG